MSRRSFDPLDCIPSAETVRAVLNETEDRARKLRELLSLAEKIEADPEAAKSGDGTKRREKTGVA